MRVLHINDQRAWGGGEQQVLSLLTGLKTAGHDLLFAGRTDAPITERVRNADTGEVITLPFRGEWDLATVLRLGNAARRFRAEIIHAHTSHAHTLACLARLRAKRLRVIVARRVAFAPRGHRLNRMKYGWPDRYIAVSRQVEQSLVDFGVLASKIDIVYSGIDLSRFRATAESREAMGISAGVRLVGTVGSLVHAKDQATLIRAMEIVGKRHPGTHLVIVGHGPLREELESLARQGGAAGSVTFAGFQSDPGPWLKAMDVFVLPSREEGLGTSVLEAMACGVPVVATRTGGIPEIVRHGETGLLTPVGDAAAMAAAIVEVLAEPGVSRQRSESARAAVEGRFTDAAMVAGTQKVYEDVMRDLERRPAPENR